MEEISKKESFKRGRVSQRNQEEIKKKLGEWKEEIKLIQEGYRLILTQANRQKLLLLKTPKKIIFDLN